MPVSDAKISVEDRAFLFADGVYEVTKILGGANGPLFFTESRHMARLRRGLQALHISEIDAAGMDIVSQIPAISRELLKRNKLASTSGENALVYVQITRGVAPRNHAFPGPSVPPTVYVITKPAKDYPASHFTEGVSCILQPDHRWARCDIKTVQLLPNCIANTAAAKNGFYEAILMRPFPGVPKNEGDEGSKFLVSSHFSTDRILSGYSDDKIQVVEASHSNVFAVVERDGKRMLITHPLSGNVLPGISREMILEKAPLLQIPNLDYIGEGSFTFADITNGSVLELMVTSTGPNLLPVVTVHLPGKGTDELIPVTISSGKVGPVASALLEGFGRWIEEERASMPV